MASQHVNILMMLVAFLFHLRSDEYIIISKRYLFHDLDKILRTDISNTKQDVLG